MDAQQPQTTPVTSDATYESIHPCSESSDDVMYDNSSLSESHSLDAIDTDTSIPASPPPDSFRSVDAKLRRYEGLPLRRLSSLLTKLDKISELARSFNHRDRSSIIDNDAVIREKLMIEDRILAQIFKRREDRNHAQESSKFTVEQIGQLQ
jgi:hypothetical protein